MIVEISDGLRFSDLNLTRDPTTGEIEFDTEPIKQIAEANPGVCAALSTEDGVSALLTAWYMTERATGYRNYAQEQVIAEVQAEDDFGAWRVQESGGSKH